MTESGLTGLLRRASDWLVEPLEDDEPGVLVAATELGGAITPAPPPRPYPLIALVGLARRCGATTIARALATELATRAGGAAVVASPGRPAVVGLGGSHAAARLAEGLPRLTHVRVAGRLCLATYADPAEIASATRHVAPAVIEVEPGVAALEAAPVVDRVVLVASPSLEPALAAAVAETIVPVGGAALLVVNRATADVALLAAADVAVPDSRMSARFALAGREPRGLLARSVEELADLCVPA